MRITGQLFSFILLSVLTIHRTSWADFINQPAEKKAEYYLQLKQQLPEVFQSQGGWFVNPTQVAQNESLFLQWYNLNYAQALLVRERPSGAENFKISAAIEKQEFQSAPVLNDAISEKLTTYLGSLSTLSIESAKSAALAEFKSMDNQSSMGVITGLIQSLPNEFKGQAFKLPNHEKLAFLQTHLNDEQVKKNFRSAFYKPEQISKDYLLAEIHRLTEIEQRLAYYALYIRWIQNNKDLAAVIDAGLDSPHDLFSSLEAEGKILASERKKLTDATSSAVSAMLKPHVIQGQRPVWTAQQKFSIEILPENHAVYRGSLNGDCFTTYAFGFAYAPSERTLIVRDDSGKYLMTIYSIVAQIDGKKVLYVHDMGHSTTSADYGPLTMRALYSARKQLGVDEVAIGQKGMHHYQFGQSIQASAKITEFKPITFYDIQSRIEIGDALVEITKQGYSKSHDLADSHPNGRFYEPNDNAASRITAQVELDVKKSTGEQNKEPLSRSQLQELAFDLIFRGQTEILSSIFDPASAAKLERTVLNRNVQPVEQFYQSIAQLMNELDLPWDELAQKRAEPLLQKGYLNAPDAWNDTYKDTAANYLGNYLKANIENSEAINMLKARPQFYQTQAFEKLLRYFLKDTPASLAKAQTLLNHFTGGELSDSAISSMLETSSFTNFEIIKPYIAETMKAATLKISPASEDKFVKLAQIAPADYLDLVKRNPQILSAKIYSAVLKITANPIYEQQHLDITAQAKVHIPAFFNQSFTCRKAQAR